MADLEIILKTPMHGEDIVISGISGRFPQSRSMKEFAENLLAGIDMLTDDNQRSAPQLHALPARSGKLYDLDKFDATFFSVHTKQAHRMDPQLRMLLELTHEAIMDAGFSPASIRGSCTGVFIAVSNSESHDFWSSASNPDEINGYGLTGCYLSMFANRISFAFDFKGPSMALNAACSSSMVALAEAVNAIRIGQCEAAIVGGTQLTLKPTNSLPLQRLGLLSPEGKCKAFDAAANGYARSEAAVALYIRKRSGSLRAYATILNVKARSDGFKEGDLTEPSGDALLGLLKETYGEAGLKPDQIDYLECDGVGNYVGDCEEIRAVTQFFCNGSRGQPLPIGSVKSNMGNAEAAAGMCQLAKVLISIQKGVIPANLHFEKPAVPSLEDGRLQVVTQNQEWHGGFIGINSLSFSGVTAHVILKSNPKISSSSLCSNHPSLPRLIPFSGRTREGVQHALERISASKDDESIALLQKIALERAVAQAFSGYAVLRNSGEVQIDIQETPRGIKKPPVWFIFSGMGSQWDGMGRDLLQFNAFEASIRHSSEVLKDFGLDLFDMIQDNENKVKPSLRSAVSITAIQVALVDILASIGIFPEGLIGHSVGELGCAYADGCLTAEETVLAAYARAEAFLRSNNPVGAMAAVGLTWEEASGRCPPNIYPACHNARDSVTISGPPHSVRSFVQQLQSEGIFAKEVDSNGFAFHSKYVAASAPKLSESLTEIIRNPKSRSRRWISTSLAPSQRDSELARTASAAYFVNNMVSPVRFYDALAHVPANAVVIEVAPHCLLRAVMKRALPSSCFVACLSDRAQSDNAAVFLTTVGKMRNQGLLPDVSKLYDEMEFPVSARANMISPLVKWDHSATWDVASFTETGRKYGPMSISVSLANTEDRILFGGLAIHGSVIFPPSGYVYLVWKTFAELQGASVDQLPVVLEDLTFPRTQVVEKGSPLTFYISILPVTGKFQVLESNTVVASGLIRLAEHDAANLQYEDQNPEPEDPTSVFNASNRILMTKHEVYRELEMRGYAYEAHFRGIRTVDIESNWGMIEWKGSWVALLDSMFQFAALSNWNSDVTVLKHLERLALDPQTLIQSVQGNRNEEGLLFVTKKKYFNMISCHGVEMRGLEVQIVRRMLTPRLPKNLMTMYHAGKWSPCQHHLLIENDDCVDVQHAAVTVLAPGDLSTLTWFQRPSPEILQKEPVPTHFTVSYAGLNTRDVRIALGAQPPSKAIFDSKTATPFGTEFAGQTSTGKKIMGCLAAGALSTSLDHPDSVLTWEVPSNWSLEEAATVPHAYATAYNSLLVRGNLKPGESVLIYCGSDSTAKAACSIALNMKCRIFVAIDSNIEQKAFQTLFPELCDSCLVILQDSSLEHFILEQTEGRGVDVILSSAAGEMSFPALRCLAQHGRFLDVSPSTAETDARLGMEIFLQNISYHGVQFEALFDPKYEPERRQVAKLVKKGVESGVVRPLPRRIFPMEQLESAFRAVAEGQNEEKILVEIRNESHGNAEKNRSRLKLKCISTVKRPTF